MIPDQILTALSSMAKSFGRNFTMLKEAINDLAKVIKEDRAETRKTLHSALVGVQQAIQKVEKPVFEGTVEMDVSPIAPLFNQLCKDVRDSFNTRNFDNVEASLKLIYSALKGISDRDILTKLDALEKAIKAIKLDVGTLKLDEMQFRALSSGSGSGGGGGVLVATQVAQTNVSMASSNTQYSYTFPANTVMWRMKLRAQNAAFLYSWTAGTLPTSGDGSKYVTIPANFLDSRDGINYGGKTIYFQSASASQTMEIEVGTL